MAHRHAFVCPPVLGAPPVIHTGRCCCTESLQPWESEALRHLRQKLRSLQCGGSKTLMPIGTLAPAVMRCAHNQAPAALQIFTRRWRKGIWDLRAIVDSGGMPSSHSALCSVRD